jgi:hypothetical protein
MSDRARELKDRAWFWHFWKITPAEYRSLTVAEHLAMQNVMKEVARANRRARGKRG